MGITQSVEGVTRTVRQKKNKFALLVCTGICFLLPLNCVHGSQVFKLRLGLVLSTPWFSDFWFRLNYATSFPGSQLADSRSWVFLTSSSCDPISNINLPPVYLYIYIYTYISIYPISVSLDDSNNTIASLLYQITVSVLHDPHPELQCGYSNSVLAAGWFPGLF